jgi:cysteine desulfurase/selenocysteine lyase
MLKIDDIRRDFPILDQKVYDKPLVYFDNAATTQKPRVVIDRLINYYQQHNSNIHRGVHRLSLLATEAFENARQNVRRFINASHTTEIIFTKGTTESINLIAATYGEDHLGKNDEVLISAMEHHSNIVPWQMVCQKTGARLRVIPMDDNGELIQDEYLKLLSEKTKIVALTHVSNTLGTINPVKEMIRAAHNQNIPVLIDGAQAASHLSIDVKDLGCDFYCFSGHKSYAPMGGGVLYVRKELLENMKPYQGGGEMVESVTFEKTTYNELPFRFEAGTPNVEAILGLDSALGYLEKIGLDEIANYEHELLEYGISTLGALDKIRFVGTARDKTSIISFLIDGIHPYDAGTIIDRMGVAVRTGHHCAQPVMDWYGIPGTIRASLAFYNTKEEIDRLAEAVETAKKMLS